MTHVHKKMLVAGLILTAAVGYLTYTGIAAGKSYYMSVDAFLADPSFHSHRVQLHGLVDSEAMTAAPEDGKMGFGLLGDTGKLRIRYGGVVPDLFKPGAAVVVVGKMGPDAVFDAEQVLTKCASKYEAMPERAGGRS